MKDLLMIFITLLLILITLSTLGGSIRIREELTPRRDINGGYVKPYTQSQYNNVDHFANFLGPSDASVIFEESKKHVVVEEEAFIPSEDDIDRYFVIQEFPDGVLFDSKC